MEACLGCRKPQHCKNQANKNPAGVFLKSRGCPGVLLTLAETWQCSPKHRSQAAGVLSPEESGLSLAQARLLCRPSLSSAGTVNGLWEYMQLQPRHRKASGSGEQTFQDPRLPFQLRRKKFMFGIFDSSLDLVNTSLPPQIMTLHSLLTLTK